MAPKAQPVLLNRIAWYYFIFDLPPDWEITAFSTSEVEGRFELSTRDGFKGQVSWQKSKREPDHTRMMTEFHLRYLRDNRPEDVSFFKDLKLRNAGQFSIGYAEKGDPCQAQAYIPEEEILLRWVFPEYDPDELDKIWNAILKSFKPNREEQREWGFFGIRCRLPRDFEINTASAMPANIAITFESSRPYRISCHRWGLPELVLEGTTLRKFYRKFLVNSACKVGEYEEMKLFGYEGGCWLYKQRGMRGMNKLYGAPWSGRGFIWHNTDEQRIYACEMIGGKKVPSFEVEDVFSV